jgi:hypothetical protein
MGMNTTSNLAAIGLVSHAVNELRYGIDVQDCSIHVDHGRKMVVINGKAIDAAFVAKVRELCDDAESLALSAQASGWAKCEYLDVLNNSREIAKLSRRPKWNGHADGRVCRRRR